ncbi:MULTISPECIES: WbqC family protein [Pseudomonas fluorescens group]|uniref:WbqC-like protein family protein n=1 Tax=Pseudomonas fluorescens TaxID=294 RepID=A0A0D0SMI5_PSEFL|nr:MULTISPECIES: WbqC family protein [Pseudomonas fluorescens group]AZE60100.1 hypothetical protein C4K02_1724 [Pseudomonas synxantha]KIR23163.1 WbqC-like protein family protein [Pseudomonas fluorescens]
MKLAIMQPYFFPYVGYFKLVSEVDKFVFLDDVNYINRGWINRNRLFLAGEVRYITVPLVGASQNLRINDIFVQPKEVWQPKLLDVIRQSYSKAPNFSNTFELIKHVLQAGGPEDKISDVSRRSVVETSKCLGLDTHFIETSSIYENARLKGPERIVDICLRADATEYFNLPGGEGLYEKDFFTENDLNLKFVSPALVPYSQFGRDFAPGLSIIDVLMFNSFEESRGIVLS